MCVRCLACTCHIASVQRKGSLCHSSPLLFFGYWSSRLNFPPGPGASKGQDPGLIAFCIHSFHNQTSIEVLLRAGPCAGGPAFSPAPGIQVLVSGLMNEKGGLGRLQKAPFIKQHQVSELLFSNSSGLLPIWGSPQNQI